MFANDLNVNGLKNIPMTEFEPKTMGFSMMKAAFMAYEKEFVRVYANWDKKCGKEAAEVSIQYQKRNFNSIVKEKQEELAEHIADTTGERMEIESPVAPHAPINYIKGIFGEEPFLENV